MVRIPVVPVVLLSLTCSFAFISSCKSPDALVQLDVVGDQEFDKVNLTLSARGTRKTFPGITFSPSKAFAAGMYLPSSITGSVDIVASVDNGVCTNGAGQVTIPLVSSGNVTPPVLLAIRGMACAPLPDAGTGTGGDDRGAGGGGGIAGTGGAPGGQGGMTGAGGSPPGQGGGPGGAIGTGGIVGTGTGGVIGGGTGGVGNGAGGANGGTGGAAGCGDLIDDMEADTGKICEGNGRAGHWFTYIDALSGSTITPATTQVPALPYPISPPRGSSQYAMRAFGTYGSYAGIAALVNNSVIGATPKTFDASHYTGVRFTAKGSGGIKLIVQTSATESTMYGGTCTLASCYGATYTVPGVAVDTWNVFSVPFTSLTRGNAAFSSGDVWSVEFQPSSLGSFDIWIDDVTFY